MQTPPKLWKHADIVDGEANDVEDIEFLKIHKNLVEADNDCEDDERKKEKSGRSTRAVD